MGTWPPACRGARRRNRCRAVRGIRGPSPIPSAVVGSDLELLAERLGDIRTPVQIIAGRHDTLVPPSNAEFLHARLADSKLDILETGHFAWEDGADDYLELTRSWIEAHSTARFRP
jgi:pimeloyl-ACP methyl ester carboxylesterase